MLAVEKITLNYETTLTGCETLPVFGWIITSTLRDVQQRQVSGAVRPYGV